MHMLQCVNPHTDDWQFFLDNFVLTSFNCLYVWQKIDKFFLTRSLVQKLVMLAFEPGKLFVCTADQEKIDKEML